MALNYSIPDSLIGKLFVPDVLANLETVSLDVVTVANSTIKAQRINETVINLAALFERTNGTASVDAIADFFGAPVERVEFLQSVFGGNETFMQSVLWFSRAVKGSTDWPVNGGILALVIIFLIVSYITTALRLWARYRFHDQGIRFVDYCIVAAMVVITVIAGDFGNNINLLINEGTGSIWLMSFNTLSLTQVHAEIEGVVYYLAIFLIKMSLLLFYAEMTHPKSFQRKIVYFVMFISFAANAAGFFFHLFKCNPVGYWNNWLEYTCVPYRQKFIFGVGIANIITDILIWLLPMPVLFKLQVSTRTRVLSLLVILSSFIAVIFSALRVQAIWLGHASAVQTGNLADFSTSYYAQIEMHTMIWAYNVPAIRSIVLWYRNRAERLQAAQNSYASEMNTFGSKSKGTKNSSANRGGDMIENDDWRSLHGSTDSTNDNYERVTPGNAV